MPSLKSITEHDVIEAAFSAVRKNGISALTARSVAKELNSSTMPVYSCISSINELRPIIVKKITALFLEYLLKKYTGNTHTDSCVGYVIFACEEKKLFHYMFLDDSDKAVEDFNEQRKFVEKKLEERTATDIDMKKLSAKQKKIFNNAMLVHIHGLACFASKNRLAGVSEKDTIEII